MSEEWRNEIEGRFSYAYINTVEPGDGVEVKVGYWAINPGAWYWKTFLIATIASPELKQELDTTRELGQEARRAKSYWLADDIKWEKFYMPNYPVAVVIQLFGHDDANKQWNWTEYDAWAYYGYIPPDFPQPLCYAVVYLSPRGPNEPSAPATSESQIIYTGGMVPIPGTVPLPPPPVPRAGGFPWGIAAVIGGGVIILGSLIKKN